MGANPARLQLTWHVLTMQHLCLHLPHAETSLPRALCSRPTMDYPHPRMSLLFSPLFPSVFPFSHLALPVCAPIVNVLTKKDGDMLHGTIFDNWLNSPAHHTLHHLLFHYNMGQYFVWADRYWGTEKLPMPELDPLIAAVQNMRRQGVEIDERGRKVRKGTHGGVVVSDSEEEREKKE